jgi:hypothetical protein
MVMPHDHKLSTFFFRRPCEHDHPRASNQRDEQSADAWPQPSAHDLGKSSSNRNAAEAVGHQERSEQSHVGEHRKPDRDSCDCATAAPSCRSREY